MSVIFNKDAYPAGSAKARMLNNQWDEVVAERKAGAEGFAQFFTNAGRSPADAYREFDSTTKIEVVPAGHLATLTRVLQVNKPVDIGREVYEYRQASRAGTAQSSMSGRQSVVIDHTSYDYAGTVVPIHDESFGLPWRQKAAYDAEGFDGLVDEARNAERTLMEHVEKYMWEGDSSLIVKGAKWEGIKNDASVASTVMAVDTTDQAVTGKAIRDEFKRLRDILRINNNCTGDLTFSVSRETKSRLEDEFDTTNSSNVTVEEMILKLSGIAEIVEDAYLSGNEIAVMRIAEDAFHSVIGMPISTVPEQRLRSRDDYTFLKQAAIGFIAKQSKSGLKCALFASAV